MLYGFYNFKFPFYFSDDCDEDKTSLYECVFKTFHFFALTLLTLRHTKKNLFNTRRSLYIFRIQKIVGGHLMVKNELRPCFCERIYFWKRFKYKSMLQMLFLHLRLMHFNIHEIASKLFVHK